MTRAPLYYQAAMFLTSPTVWESISPADREIFVQAAKEAGQTTRTAVEKAEAEGVAKLREHGMVVSDEYDRASFDRALAPVYKRFSPRMDQAVIDAIRKAGR